MRHFKRCLTFAVHDPCNGKPIGNVPDMGVKETILAIEKAHKSLQTSIDGAKILDNWYHLVNKNTLELAKIITMESGKPLREAKAEVAYAASYIKFFSEEANRIYGKILPGSNKLFVQHQPVGVCSLITPWNFPLAMLARKISPAIAAGCTAVIKPAHETPLTALRYIELGYEAGLDVDKVHVITTKSHIQEVGHCMTTHPLVKKISFTGSTRVGKLLASQASQTMKRMSMELGGNAPFIVFEDANLEKAVQGLLVAKFRNAGQTCVAANRIFIQSSVLPRFLDILVPKVKEMKVGPGMEDADIGPLISKAGVDKVNQHIDDAIAKGATVVLKGTTNQQFVSPTILNNVSTDALMFTDETFGPVIAIYPFETEQQVIQMANDTKYGLAGYFYSENVSRIFRVSEALEVGMVGVNEGLISKAIAPFGGVKESGLGREGSYKGLDEYLNTKYVCLST